MARFMNRMLLYFLIVIVFAVATNVRASISLIVILHTVATDALVFHFYR